MPRIKTLPGLAALGALMAVMGACSSVTGSPVPASYLTADTLDQNRIQAVKRTEFLEIAIDPYGSELSDRDRTQIRAFVREYNRVGHGPLVLSLPQATSNPQLAVTAVVEAREIAWEAGVRYTEMSGTHHGAGAALSEPLILAYQRYEAIAPNCPLKSQIDIAQSRSNNHLPTLGCAVRTNLAAMIADPADLLGQTPIDPADTPRRMDILEKFRTGAPTASQGNENGAVSSAVN